MLTESEILDEQTQTLEEALDKLADHENHPVTQNTALDTGAGQTVQITVECLKALVDLHNTISQEGVSADDIRAMRHIRERMAPFMTLSYRPALESYEGMFTPGRSMINQTVSKEASLEEIGLTLKEWFFKFIDFIIKVVDWCRIAWNSEFAIKTRLGVIDNNVQSMYNEFDRLLKRNQSAGRDYNGEMNAIWKQVLQDPQLGRSQAMLYAFGMTEDAGVYVKANDAIDDAYRWILMDIVGLKNRIEKSEPMELTHTYADEVHEAAVDIEALAVASSDVNYLLDHLPKDYWRKPKVILARKSQVPSHNISQVQVIAKKLREIRRNGKFPDLKDNDAMVHSIQNITDTISGIERTITVKQNLFTDFYKASATLVNFYSRGYEFLLAEAQKHDNDDASKAMNDRAAKVWDSICTKMGI